jgi:hypothetical protein
MRKYMVIANNEQRALHQRVVSISYSLSVIPVDFQ